MPWTNVKRRIFLFQTLYLHPEMHSASTEPPSSASLSLQRTACEAGLTIVGDCRGILPLLLLPKVLPKLEKNSSSQISKFGVKPVWGREPESTPQRRKAGIKVLMMKNDWALLDRCWSWFIVTVVDKFEEGHENSRRPSV